MTLKPKKGFDWGKVVWYLTDPPPICSYCSGHVPEASVPLMLFNSDRNRTAHFCDGCQKKWWGVQSVG